MAYEYGTYYTGQIDVITRLPHGLGTLRRDAGGGILLEGEWRMGTLVASSAAAVPPAGCRQRGSGRPASSFHDIEDDYDEDTDRHHRLPTTDDEQDDEDDDDDDSSISSTPTEWTSSSAPSSYPLPPRGNVCPAYSARESKPSTITPYLDRRRVPRPPPPKPSHARPTTLATNGTRATFDRLCDYEEYVDACDENGDWYYHDNDERKSRNEDDDNVVQRGYRDYEYDRARRVRFLGDP